MVLLSRVAKGWLDPRSTEPFSQGSWALLVRHLHPTPATTTTQGCRHGGKVVRVESIASTHHSTLWRAWKEHALPVAPRIFRRLSYNLK